MRSCALLSIANLPNICITVATASPPTNAMKAESEAYKDVDYHSLPDDSLSSRDSLSDGLVQNKPARRKPRNLLCFGAGCATIILLAILVFTINRFFFPPKTAEQVEAEEWNYCGRSAAAAKARGCVLEPNFYGWMPKQCVFPELTAAHPVFEDRTWYSDFNMTQKRRPEQLWAGDLKMVYASQ